MATIPNDTVAMLTAIIVLYMIEYFLLYILQCLLYICDTYHLHVSKVFHLLHIVQIGSRYDTGLKSHLCGLAYSLLSA